MARARHIVAELPRRHVFIEALPGTKGTMQLAIVFNAEPPFRGPSTRPLSYPMIGWLIGRCHASFMHESQAGPLDVATVAAADVRLSAYYPTGAIVCAATFKARMRSWRDQ